MMTTTMRRVHVYCRGGDEWVVFESGRFQDHVIFTAVDDAVRYGRKLAAASDATLKTHGLPGPVTSHLRSA
jgi:hypothetical protein